MKTKAERSSICKYEPNVVSEIRKGAYMGTKECALQFSKRRWNCTTVRKSMKKVLERDTREAAFVHAITTAGATYAVAQACSLGLLLECRSVVCKRSISGRLNYQYFHPICNSVHFLCLFYSYTLSLGSFNSFFISFSFRLSFLSFFALSIHFICC